MTFCIIIGCSTKSNTQPSSKLEFEEGCIMTILDNFDKNVLNFSSSAKVWFWDNEIVQEIKRIHFNTDTNNIQTVTEYLDYYAYVNYDLKQFWLYYTLSDTAKPFKHFYTLDSLSRKSVTDFYGLSKKPLEFVVALEPMSDTVIDNEQYTRKKYIKNWKNKRFVTVAYLNCYRPDSRFSFFKNLQDSCAPVKVVNYNEDETLCFGSTEIKFLEDRLSEDKKRIFKAWRQNIED